MFAWLSNEITASPKISILYILFNQSCGVLKPQVACSNNVASLHRSESPAFGKPSALIPVS